MSDESTAPEADESRIRLLSGNGARRPKDKRTDWATKGDVEDLVVKVCEHYMAQVPAHIQGVSQQIIAQMVPPMINGALQAYELIEIKKPETPAVVDPATQEPSA